MAVKKDSQKHNKGKDVVVVAAEKIRDVTRKWHHSRLVMVVVHLLTLKV